MGKIKRKTILFVIIFILSLGIVKVTDFELHKSSETEFCISCHSMKIPYDDYIKSPHYANQHGVSAQCKDCHINNGRGASSWSQGPSVQTCLVKIKKYQGTIPNIDCFDGPKIIKT